MPGDVEDQDRFLESLETERKKCEHQSCDVGASLGTVRPLWPILRGRP